MSSTARKPALPTAPATEDRRNKVLRELKLSLVDQHVNREGAGCNPYDTLQDRGRADRWDYRRRR